MIFKKMTYFLNYFVESTAISQRISPVYFNMVFVMLVGSQLVISSGGALIDVGQMSAMLTYGMQILMQLY